MRLIVGYALLLSTCTAVSSQSTLCTNDELNKCTGGNWDQCLGCKTSESGGVGKYCVLGVIPADEDICSDIATNPGVPQPKPGFQWTPLGEVTALQPSSSAPLFQDQPLAMNSVGDVAIAPETDFGILNVDLGLPSPGLAAGDKTLFDDSRTADADLIDIFTGQPFESATILDGNFYNNLQLNDANPLESQQGKEDAGCANLNCPGGKVCTRCYPDEASVRTIVQCMPANYCTNPPCSCTILSPDEYFNVLKQGWDDPFLYNNKPF